MQSKVNEMVFTWMLMKSINTVMDSGERVLIKIKQWQELSETFVYRIELVPLTLKLHKIIYSQRYFTAEGWYTSVYLWKFTAF